MQFHHTEIHGAWIVEPEPHGDDRGSFARVFCTDEFAAHDIDFPIVQGNVSISAEAGTVRGLHYQLPPHGEAKYLRVERGAIQEVVVDLRPWSPTHLAVCSVELSAANRRGLVVPALCANGFQILEADTAVAYVTTAAHVAAAERGFRADDPAFDLAWPLPLGERSAKDLAWPDLDVEAAGAELSAAIEAADGPATST